MTHDELLAAIRQSPVNMTLDSEGNPTYWYSDNPTKQALRAAVKLHKPFLYPEDDLLYCEEDNQPYPCGTIQFIEKELK